MPTKEDCSPNGFQIAVSIYKKKIIIKLKQTQVSCTNKNKIK